MNFLASLAPSSSVSDKRSRYCSNCSDDQSTSGRPGLNGERASSPFSSSSCAAAATRSETDGSKRKTKEVSLPAGAVDQISGQVETSRTLGVDLKLTLRSLRN